MKQARLQIIGGGRYSGKSTRLFRWVFAGERCDGYPGWTRVLVLGDIHEEEYWRERWRDFDFIPKDAEWADLDWSHRIYFWADWIDAMGVASTTEVRVDGIERFIPRIPGVLTGFSFNQEADLRQFEGP